MVTRRRHDPVTDLLRSTLRLRRQTRLLYERCLRLTASAEATTPHYSPVSGTAGGEQRKDSLWIAVAEAEAELTATQKEYWDKEEKVHRLLQRMQSLPQRAILQYRYCDGLSWPEVQERLESIGIYYSERHMFNLHGDALQEARRLWESEGMGHEDSNSPITDE
jgi:DNA-directed RNA polymerase specialized sigma subunit